MSERIEQIKKLHRFTKAGLTRCKQALETSNYDFFAAVVSLVNEEDVKEMAQSMRVRQMAGQSIKDPVTREECDLIEGLLAHFIAKRTRTEHVLFAEDVIFHFLRDRTFAHHVINAPSDILIHLWRNLVTKSMSPFLIPTVGTTTVDKEFVTIIWMPTPQSEWECDFVVLAYCSRRFLLPPRRRAFVIYKKNVELGFVVIDEIKIKGPKLSRARRFYVEGVTFTDDGIALACLAPSIVDSDPDGDWDSDLDC